MNGSVRVETVSSLTKDVTGSIIAPMEAMNWIVQVDEHQPNSDSYSSPLFF